MQGPAPRNGHADTASRLELTVHRLDLKEKLTRNVDTPVPGGDVHRQLDGTCLCVTRKKQSQDRGPGESTLHTEEEIDTTKPTSRQVDRHLLSI